MDQGKTAFRNNVDVSQGKILPLDAQGSGVKTIVTNWNELKNTESGSIRLVIIADAKMDWAARLTIASARIRSGFPGKIIMLGDVNHPEFNRRMGVEYHDLNTAGQGFLPDTPWGPFRTPMKKPFLIRKFFQGTTIFLDADIFCAAPFHNLGQNCRTWACAITKQNPHILPPQFMNLWGVTNPPTRQFNSGVLVFKDRAILDQWCAVFEESRLNRAKYDYLMNRQPWSYDQIGLIIAAARTGLEPEVIDQRYNFEVAAKGWQGSENAAIVHFTNWKVLNYPELLCLNEKAPASLLMAEVGRMVQQIEDRETAEPALVQVQNPLRAQKVTRLAQERINKRLMVGASQGIGNVIFATPMLKALLKMGWQVDLPAGVFNNGAESVLQGLGVSIVDQKTIMEHGPYFATLQSVWPVKGLERLAGRTIYAAPCHIAWQQNLYVHEVEANMSLAYALGFKDDIPSLYCHRQACPMTDELSRISDPLVGLHICTKYANQLFANRRLRHPHKIAAALAGRGYRVVLLGGPGTVINPADYPENCINLIGSLTLAQSADAIARLDALVTEDCGITHVAAAMDCPQVSIFGPTSVVKNRPWNNKAQVLMSAIDCQPCQFTEMAMKCQDNRCMLIDPELIAGHVDRLLAAVARDKAPTSMVV